MRDIIKLAKNGTSITANLRKEIATALDLKAGDLVLINVHKVIRVDDEEATQPPRTEKGQVFHRPEMLAWMEEGNVIFINAPYDEEPHNYKIREE